MTTTTPQTTVARRTRLAAAVIAVTAWLVGSAPAIAAPPGAGPPAGTEDELVLEDGDEPLDGELAEGAPEAGAEALGAGEAGAGEAGAGRKAVDLHARMLGREHPATGLDIHLEAQILGELGEHAEALALAREAREVFEAARGPGHVEVATMIELEGTLWLENEEYPRAEERLRESLRIFCEQAGDGSPQASASRLLLAQALARTDQVDEAIAHGRRALDDYIRLFGPEHIRVVNARSILGEILLDDGQYEPARRELEQALVDLDPAFNIGHRAELRYLLARALLEPRADMVEGRRQLELAERELGEAGESFEYGRRLLAQWRRDHAELLR